MTSKELILKNIRTNNVVQDTSLPDYSNFGLTFDDKHAHFSTMLESVGGKALFIKKEELEETIKSLYPDEKLITSNIEGFSLANFDANEEADPHNLKDIDLEYLFLENDDSDISIIEIYSCVAKILDLSMDNLKQIIFNNYRRCFK